MEVMVMVAPAAGGLGALEMVPEVSRGPGDRSL